MNLSTAFYLFINCHFSITVTWSFELQKFCASEPQPSRHSAWTAHLCHCCYLTAQKQTRYRNLGTCSQHMVITVPVCNLGYLMSVSPAVPSLFGARDWLRGRLFFHRPGSGDGFRVIQALYIYCALLLHQFRLRSSSVRSWRLGTPALVNSWAFCWCLRDPMRNICTLSRSTFTW